MSSIATDEIPDGHTLNIALKANNLPTYGTKAMKWARLQSGESGRKKPGRKGKVAKDSGVDTKEQEKFFKSQIPGLVAMGIVDEDDQATEVKRRWVAMKKAQVKTSVSPIKSASAKGAEIRLDQALDDVQLKSTGLSFVTVDQSGPKPIFVFTKGSPSSTAKDSKATAAPKKEALSAKAPSLKRKKVEEEEEEEEDDDDDDYDDYDDLDWACEISKERLLKKCRKETLQAMCVDFGVSSSGSKEQLADMLSEQLHAETDDEEEEE